MRTIHRYFLLYKEFFKTSLSEELSFRANFTLQSLMNLCTIGVYFFTSLFIFNHIENIGPWNEAEFFLFLAFVFAIDQTHYLLFSFNFWIFSEDIRLGQLDFHLLKPFPTIFTVLFRRLAIPGIFTALLTYAMLIYFGIQADLSVLAWLSLPFCLILSLALLLGLEAFLSLFNFFTVEGMGLNQVRLQLQNLLRWPDFIYKNPYRIWLIPFLAVSSIPARWLLDFSYWSWLLIMFLGAVFVWSLVLFLWPLFVRFYESPSS